MGTGEGGYTVDEEGRNVGEIAGWA